jgi:hypothetical protein
MSQINTIVINITLDGQNYPEWAFSVETALRGCGLYFHLTNDPPARKFDGVMLMLLKPWKSMMER